MKIEFYKYQGTGNDFVLMDNRQGIYSDLTPKQINLLCNRRFGIGGDGLMLLNNKVGFDFEMKYFNSDGKEGSMCGNGARCIIKFASMLGIKKPSYNFSAADGTHEGEIDLDGEISLKMNNVDKVEIFPNH